MLYLYSYLVICVSTTINCTFTVRLTVLLTVLFFHIANCQFAALSSGVRCAHMEATCRTFSNGSRAVRPRKSSVPQPVVTTALSRELRHNNLCLLALFPKQLRYPLLVLPIHFFIHLYHFRSRSCICDIYITDSLIFGL